MTDTETQLREQIQYEQFVNSFYIDLILNHVLEDTGYSKFILELVREIKDDSKDLKELNTRMKNIPGTVREKIMNGELKDLLDIK